VPLLYIITYKAWCRLLNKTIVAQLLKLRAYLKTYNILSFGEEYKGEVNGKEQVFSDALKLNLIREAAFLLIVAIQQLVVYNLVTIW
jgi:hypothetical protein